MTVDIEIICIGNELLIGKVENTNAHWLSKQITELGANVTRITVIQDIIEEIAKVINEAKDRKPQFIVTTGGLGPTFDDKTLQGVAKALNRQLEINPIALEMVKQGCIKYPKTRQHPGDVELTLPRVKMARFPEKTEPVTNPIGTAPGLQVDMEGSLLFVLPGVPLEMEGIFSQTIAPLIKQAAGQEVFCQRSLFAEDVMESQLAPLIDTVMADNESVYIKSHPMHSETKPHIELHLTIRSDHEKKPSAKLFKAAKEIEQLIEQMGGKVTVEP